MKLFLVEKDLEDNTVYAIKISSDMTGDNFYICSKDEDALYDYEYDIKEAFFKMIYAEDDYWWGIANSKYLNLLDDLGFYELNDIEEPVDESQLEIISRYSSRF